MGNKRYFIDAGANNSCSARLFRFKYDKNNDYYIYSFEVDPRFFKCFNDIPKLTFINKAVWTKAGEELFYLSYDPSMSGGTLFKKIQSGKLDKEHPIKITTFDFSQWVLDTFNKEDEIILKMDIEGSEYPVLEKMFIDGSFDYINELWIEWHWSKVKFEEQRHIDLVNKIKIPIVKWAGLEEARKVFGDAFFKGVCSNGK